MVEEYPSQSYYPSAKVRLIIRFDEFGDNGVLAKRVPAKSYRNLNGVKVDRNSLTVQLDPGAAPGVNKLILAAPSAASSEAAQDASSSLDDLTFVLGGIIPKEASLAMNGVRSADTLTSTLKFIDCPIDPRVVRSCAIEYYLGAVPESDYLLGLRGKGRAPTPPGTGQLATTGDEPLNVVADTYTDGNGKPRTNLRFQGWVDKWVVEWPESGEPSIRLECRDNTALLIGQPHPPRLVLSLEKPIDAAVADYLSHFPQLQGMSVEYRPPGESIPTLKSALSRDAYRPNLGPPQSKTGSSSEQTSAWDYLTDRCRAIGHALFVDGTVVVIQRVRSLFSSNVAGRADDPFQGRTLTSGASFSSRRFIYGRNILDMRASRNMTTAAPQNIEVRSYVGATKGVIVARFPLADDRLAYAIPGNATPDQKWLVVNISGISDPKTLRAAAQDIYESRGRNEFAFEIKTRNLASFGAGNADPDLLDLKAGDSVEVLVNRDEREFSTLTRIESYLVAQNRNAEFMKSLGFDPKFASAYAKAYTNAGFQTIFRVKSAKVDWSVDEGVSFSLDVVNYMEIRSDKALPAGEEPVAAANAKRPPSSTDPTPGIVPGGPAVGLVP